MVSTLTDPRCFEIQGVARVLRKLSCATVILVIIETRKERPHAKEAKEKLVHVGIQVPPEVKQRWEAMAEEIGWSVSEWCWWQIEKAILPHHFSTTEHGPPANMFAIR